MQVDGERQVEAQAGRQIHAISRQTRGSGGQIEGQAGEAYRKGGPEVATEMLGDRQLD
jgi:hypothetical protein